MEWLQIVYSLRRLRVHIPFEEPQTDSIRKKIGDGEAVLLDRLYFFPDVQVRGRSRAYTSERRWPTAWTGSNWTGQDCSHRSFLQVELARAENTANRDSMQIAADSNWDPALHGSDRGDDAIVLFKPARLPVGLRLGGRQFSGSVEYVRIPFHPLTGSPPHRIGRQVYQMRNIRRTGAR